MSRIPRQIIAHVPIHITQRGVDRGPTFLEDEDFAFYRWALREAACEALCAVHAYVLMTNHVHLLATPEGVDGPARMMASLGRRYVRYFNDRYRRSGTLWEGRYRSALVDSTAYLFACSRYIELNPVRAGIAADPAEYEWSSYRHNARGLEDGVITPHFSFAELGNSDEARCDAYRATFSIALPSSTLATVRAEPRGRPGLYSTSYQQAVATLFDPPVATSGDEVGDARWRVPRPRVMRRRSPTTSGN